MCIRGCFLVSHEGGRMANLISGAPNEVLPTMLSTLTADLSASSPMVCALIRNFLTH